MIRRNEIPILEYDDSSSEVIPPDHDWTADRLPEKCLFAFLGDVVHEYAAKHNARVVETLITVSHTRRPGFLFGFIDYFTAGLFFLLYMPLGGLQQGRG